MEAKALEIATPPLKKIITSTAIGLVLATTTALYCPHDAYASVSKCSLESLPFETAAQEAGHPVWSKSTTVKVVGGAKKSKHTWYTGISGYELYKPGDGITVANIGTDLDGSAIDLRITLQKSDGASFMEIFGSGSISGRPNTYEKARIDVMTESGAPKPGENLLPAIRNSSNGDVGLKFEYLKHGTSSKANCHLFGQIHDIDFDNSRDLPYWVNPVFGGLEGVVMSNCSVYLSKGTRLSCDAAAGKIWIPASKAGDTSGEDWRTGLCYSTKSSSMTLTMGAESYLDFHFDTQVKPDEPHKAYSLQR